METIKKNDLRYILNVYDQLKNDMKISFFILNKL